jgi:hypothetical protein
MNTHIVPDLTRSQAREKFINNLEAWKNFAQRITKNPFVKNFLLERDGNRCSWCKCVLQQYKIIHHTTYEHICTYNKVIRISAPTLGQPYKTRLVADCKSCKEQSKEKFLECTNKLVLVHGMCNKIISENSFEKNF